MISSVRVQVGAPDKYQMPEYFISFQAGTCGRFTKYVLYNLLNDKTDELKLTACNAAHFHNYYSCVSMHPHGLDVYRTLTFDECDASIPKILATHTYPEFDIITKRFKNPKVILITIDQDDLLEVSINAQYKNEHIPRVNDPRHYTNRLAFISALHAITRRVSTGAFSYPHQMYPFVLNIKYKEIFAPSPDGKYIALEKLENFVGKKASNTLLQNYEKYVVGQKKFLESVGLNNYKLSPQVLGC